MPYFLVWKEELIDEEKRFYVKTRREEGVRERATGTQPQFYFLLCPAEINQLS